MPDQHAVQYVPKRYKGRERASKPGWPLDTLSSFSGRCALEVSVNICLHCRLATPFLCFGKAGQ
jgi:hypothetical protein